MLRHTISNKKSGFSFQVDANELVMQPEYGRDERWVSEMSLVDGDVVLDEREVTTLDGRVATEYLVEADYVITSVDVDALLAQEKVNADALALLASTDWMVLREMDGGVAVPSEVKEARAAARARIVRL